MEDIILTIAERLWNLRKDHGLTLETLAESVGVSKSALGTYETGNFKDISPLSIMKLAKYYGVTTDYLMGVSNLEKEADTDIQELCLTNGALDVLKSGGFNRLLLSEVMCHKDFRRLVVDMEIFVDHITDMRIDKLNYSMGATRDIVQKQYHPDENEEFYRAAELGQIPTDEYVGSILRDDLIGILRDIREAHPQKAKDETNSYFAAMEKFQKKVQAVVEEKGCPEEQVAKVYLAAWGIDYDKLAPEEFVVLVGILEKSEFKENSISRRGRNRPTSHKKRKK